ncbi:hypothetical protein ACFS5J_08325 [Flavobacterium chuncheonense]|uniref:Natural product n=1 Tax=Flavobacterium chuncheonense TaxID=2026653 RepID=A0ABW5YM11_9FLAO
MKLESLKLEKFKENALKKEQLFVLGGQNTVTPAGSGCGIGTSASNPDTIYKYDYGYDVDRGDGFITYHNRTNVSIITAEECNNYLNG